MYDLSSSFVNEIPRLVSGSKEISELSGLNDSVPGYRSQLDDSWKECLDRKRKIDGAWWTGFP